MFPLGIAFRSWRIIYVQRTTRSSFSLRRPRLGSHGSTRHRIYSDGIDLAVAIRWIFPNYECSQLDLRADIPSVDACDKRCTNCNSWVRPTSLSRCRCLLIFHWDGDLECNRDVTPNIVAPVAGLVPACRTGYGSHRGKQPRVAGQILGSWNGAELG
jgi:hypothetical protein